MTRSFPGQAHARGSGWRILVSFLLITAVGATTLHAEDLDATFRHPSGLFFRHPANWREQPVTETLLALIPPTTDGGAGASTEIFLVGGDGAEGLADPADPRLTALADRFVTQTLPFLQRRGEPSLGTKNAVTFTRMQWAGDSPTGISVEATLWIRILSDTVLTVFVATPAQTHSDRSQLAERIFLSFEYEAPKGDARLLGRWRYSSTYMSGEFSMIEHRILDLRPDGTFTEDGGLSGSLPSSDGSGGYTGDVQANSQSVSSGQWTTSEGWVRLQWNGGRVEEWEYVPSGNDLMFEKGKARKMWVRVQ